MNAFYVRVIFPLSILVLLAAQMAEAQKIDTTKTQKLKEVNVTGRSKATGRNVVSPDLTASPAAVTIAGRDYVSKQAVISYGDLLRPLTGINVTNYQLGGVGYGIEMRGYTTTEHARDIFFSVDGVPQNQGSSIQTNGYVDLNMLIPENIRRIEVVRGPFSPLYGDHALGGSIAFETENKQTSSLVFSGGIYGYLRGLGTYGFGKGDQSGYVSFEGARSDGYRQNGEEKHLNLFAKYALPVFSGIAAIRLQAYGSNFNTPGYISRADIDNGTISPTAFVSRTDGGTSRQQNLVFNYHDRDSARFNNIALYVQHHDFKRIRTNVVDGPQRQDRDNRTWFGGDFHRTVQSRLAGLQVLYVGGLSFRGDDISDARFNAVNGQLTTQSQDRQINTYATSVYGQAQVKLATALKLTLGGRYDYLFNHIVTGQAETVLGPLNIKPKTGLFSPKAGLAYQISREINIFSNISQGFRAPSAYDEYPYNRNLSVSKVTSYEIGIGGDDLNGRLHAHVTGYISRQTDEIGTDPLGNLTNFGRTRRNGIEAEAKAFVTASGSLAVFANFSEVQARAIGTPDITYITNTPKSTGLIGLDYDFGAAHNANNRFQFSCYDQLIGHKYLNTSGSIQSAAFQRLSGKLTYGRRYWNGFSIFLESSVYPGKGALTEVSFLLGNNIVTAPQAKLTVDAGIKIPFN
jgi:outer membrane receptor protein involved in Fe transport